MKLEDRTVAHLASPICIDISNTKIGDGILHSLFKLKLIVGLRQRKLTRETITETIVCVLALCQAWLFILYCMLTNLTPHNPMMYFRDEKLRH